jgi:hypothetical protein
MPSKKSRALNGFKKRKRRVTPPPKKKEMPTEARQRLAALMLDALDFGKDPNPRRLKASDHVDLKRGKAEGATKPAQRVAKNLTNLVWDIMNETKARELFPKRDEDGQIVKDAQGAVIKETRSVDEILTAWREKLRDDKSPGSVKVNAKFISEKTSKTDFERRVLSLYEALDGPLADDASKDQVKVKRVQGQEMTLPALLALYTRLAQNLKTILDVEKKLSTKKKTAKGQTRDLVDLKDAKEALKGAIGAFNLDGDIKGLKARIDALNAK